MRLVDADSLTKKIVDAPWTDYSRNAIINVINGEPTAYDIDMVVEQLLDGDIGVIETIEAITIIKSNLIK